MSRLKNATGIFVGEFKCTDDSIALEYLVKLSEFYESSFFERHLR